jgi:hypothetical protein
MWLEFIIVVLQSLSVVALGVVGILEATKRPNDGLNQVGKAFLVSAALTYVCSTSILYGLAAATQDRLMKRIEGLQSKLSDQIMRAPSEIAPRAPEKKPTTDLQISRPLSGAVNWRPLVEGRITDPKAEVWVIVHPVGLSAYWIQPPVIVHRDGTWRVPAYIGRAGDIDIEKEFEIMAIADPKEGLTEGQVFSEWPKAKWRSDIVTVVRK